MVKVGESWLNRLVGQTRTVVIDTGIILGIKMSDVKVCGVPLQLAGFRQQPSVIQGQWSQAEEAELERIVKEVMVDQNITNDSAVPWEEVSKRMGHTWGRQQCSLKWYGYIRVFFSYGNCELIPIGRMSLTRLKRSGKSQVRRSWSRIDELNLLRQFVSSS